MPALGSSVRRATAAGALVTGFAAALPGAYLAVVTAAALAPRHDRPVPARRAPLRFAVCVPAHDEEAVITETVHAMCGQSYDPTRFAVHVVADNCTDRTVELARRAGAEVHVRTAPDDPGKGPALNWLVDRLDDAYDAFVIVDADTIVEPGFLAAVDRVMATGVDAVQGYYGVRDPEASPAIAVRYAALACRHHVRASGRTALGASCGLYGNGMAFRSSLLRNRRWSGHLVEDAEFQMDLLLEGIPVAYAPDARLAAEMPADLEDAVTQHQRWELGRAQLVRRYVPLLGRRLARGGPLPRRAYADAIADHLVPPLSVTVALDAAAVVAGGAAVVCGSRRSGRLAALAGIGAAAVLAAHVAVALAQVRAPASVYRALATAPRLVAWKLGVLVGIARRPDEVGWSRTTRNTEHDEGAPRP